MKAEVLVGQQKKRNWRYRWRKRRKSLSVPSQRPLPSHLVGREEPPLIPSRRTGRENLIASLLSSTIHAISSESALSLLADSNLLSCGYVVIIPLPIALVNPQYIKLSSLCPIFLQSLIFSYYHQEEDNSGPPRPSPDLFEDLNVTSPPTPLRSTSATPPSNSPHIPKDNSDEDINLEVHYKTSFNPSSKPPV